VASKLDEARKLLAKRLEEIDRERAQLVAALEQLEGLEESSPAAATSKRSTRARGRTRGSSSRKSSNGRRKRAPRGEREKQLLNSIGTNPGYRVSEHAREVGVKPQQLYPILNRLVTNDVITKKDDRYELKGS